MSELAPEPKKHLALDTDWLTALSVIWGFLVCALIGIGLARSTLRGSFRAGPPSWSTPLLAVMLIYIALRGTNKPFKAAVLVFAIGPLSQTVLWCLRASSQTYFMNAVFVRWAYVALCFFGCAYAAYWFTGKVTHV